MPIATRVSCEMRKGSSPIERATPSAAARIESALEVAVVGAESRIRLEQSRWPPSRLRLGEERVDDVRSQSAKPSDCV